MESVARLRTIPASSVASPASVGPRKQARCIERRRIYLGEGLAVTVETAGGERVQGGVIDLTPEGMGLAVSGSKDLFAIGSTVLVEHCGRGTAGLCHRAKVTNISDGVFEGRRLLRVGVALLRERTSGSSTRNRREHERYECTERFPVSASAESPLFFRETLLFRVRQFGGGGMALSTSLGNKGLLPGMELTFKINLHMIGIFEVKGRITAIDRDLSDEEFRLGVSWIAPSKDLLHAVSEHLLLERKDRTPAKLRKGGLPVGKVDRAVTYDCADLAREYEEILALRLRSHQAEGRLEELSWEQMKSPFDAYSRHLVCRFGDRIVGYVRVIHVDGDPARSQYVSAGGHSVPEWLWRAGFVEAGAGATDPEFQRTGLFVPLMQHAARVALQSGRKFMLGACSDELLDMYQQMGFTKLETRTVRPKPGWEFRSHLILLDLEKLLDSPPEGKFVDAMASAAAFVSVHG